MIDNRKKVNMEILRNFYINLHLIDVLGMEFKACWVQLMPEEALTSFTVC